MGIKLIKFIITIFCTIGFLQDLFATNYLLPTNGGRLVGQNKIILIPKNNNQPLEYFAAKYKLGLSNMLEANPGIDPYLPKGGTLLNIPQQLILPDTIHEGIIINNAEMRLYFYRNNSNIVTILPIGIGQLGKDTPTNSTMKIERKKFNPVWIPTDKMRAEYLTNGKLLPSVVPSGPDNPMGLYALYIGNLYAIHGTNADFGIGLRVSHGCVRLRNDDMKYLFNNVPVGTRVQFINEPIKITTEPNGKCYIEVHHPLSTNEDQINNNEVVPIKLNDSIVAMINKTPNLDFDKLSNAIEKRSGIPICLN